MKKLVILLAAVFCISNSYSQNQDLIQYVNTLQGSYNTPEFSYGLCSPNVALPFAVNMWFPIDFSYVNKTVKGVGGSDFSLIPFISKTDMNERKFTLSFDPETVIGKPNHFKINADNGISMEISPTERCGFFQFTYPRSKEAYLVLNGLRKANISVNVEQRKITGYVDGVDQYQKLERHRTYFILQFDQAVVSYGASDETDRAGMYFEFKKGTTVGVKVAVSLIDMEQAEVTFNREIGPYNFNEVKDKAGKIWNDLFNRVLVEGGTLEQRKTFYSCLYWANLRPARKYEIDKNGEAHFSYNNKVHEGYYHYSPILWDAFRSLMPLHNLLNTSEQKVYLQSLQKMKPLTGWWPNGHVMIGNHAISVFADAWAKGIRTFDPDSVLKFYHHEVTHSKLDSINNREYNIEHERGFGRMGFEDYFLLGYIPYPQNTNRVMETTAKTLEYNYDDFCACQLAKMTGNKFWEGVFAKQLYNYKNMFDPSDRFMKGRDKEGNFQRNFNPYEWGGPFVEGNGWQWKWSVFHDVQGYADLMGSDEQFAKDLDALFEAPADSVLFGGYGFMIHEINEAVANGIGQYAGGNEPCFHVLYLYNYVRQPWKCQYLLRTSIAEHYNSGPKGFPGDEDRGAMSAWYVLSTLGFYSVTPGVDQYTIGSPLFNKVTITLENGNIFTIIAANNNRDNVYIQSATLNGKPYSKNWISHADILNGGELKFVMSNQPNKQRGILDEDKPFSVSRSR